MISPSYGSHSPPYSLAHLPIHLHTLLFSRTPIQPPRHPLVNMLFMERNRSNSQISEVGKIDFEGLKEKPLGRRRSGRDGGKEGWPRSHVQEHCSPQNNGRCESEAPSQTSGGHKVSRSCKQPGPLGHSTIAPSLLQGTQLSWQGLEVTLDIGSQIWTQNWTGHCPSWSVWPPGYDSSWHNG